MIVRATTRLTRRTGLLTMLVVMASLAAANAAFAAGPTIDIRGDWDASAVVGSTTYAQALHITSEDLTSGRFSGIDVGSNGAKYTVAGTVAGDTITMTISGGGYRSDTKAQITIMSPVMSMAGAFSDSNKANGSFTARLTKPGVVGSPGASEPLTGSTASPTAAISVEATASPSAVGVGPIGVPPADSTPSDGLPLPLIGLGAILLAGLGVAAAAGLVPGVPGLGFGSGPAGSGSGQGEAGGGSAPSSENPTAGGQQTARARIMQDVRISPQFEMQDPPARPSEQHSEQPNRNQDPDPEQGRPASSSSSPTPPTPPTAPDAPVETIGPASAIPTDVPPTA